MYWWSQKIRNCEGIKILTSHY